MYYKYYIIFFGLANVPGIFQSYINKCLAKMLDVFGLIYPDDIFIYTNEKEAKYQKTVN